MRVAVSSLALHLLSTTVYGVCGFQGDSFVFKYEFEHVFHVSSLAGPRLSCRNPPILAPIGRSEISFLVKQESGSGEAKPRTSNCLSPSLGFYILETLICSHRTSNLTRANDFFSSAINSGSGLELALDENLSVVVVQRRKVRRGLRGGEVRVGEDERVD
nr:hypothetical protein Iba_chr04fCG11940 [Ipomoea batatas]